MSEATIRNYVVLFTACLLFHMVGIWDLPLIDRDEPRFAEASREMRQRSEWVLPYFNDQFRFDKPPLTYWCQIGSYRLFGENDFAARFPSAVAAAFVAVVLLAWGTQLQGARSGWWAAAIFTLCLQTFVHGKAAVADMWLVLFVTLAHWAGWEMWNSGKRAFWWIFYPSLALAFLAKGPIGWTPILTLTLAHRFFQRENSGFRLFPGILLMLALICPWGIPALVRTQGEFFSVGIGKHVIGRSIASMEGHGANSFAAYLALLPFYFLTLFVSFFPWSIKLPALLRGIWRARDASDNFLLLGASIIFFIFTMVKTKLPHYTLPAFPLIALLMARRAEHLQLSRTAVWCTGGVLLVIALAAPPFFSKLVPSYVLATDSRPNLQAEMEFGAIDYNEPSLVWYFRREIRGFMKPLRGKDAQPFLSKPGPRFLILPTGSVEHLFPQLDPSWGIYHARGWNVAKGERVDVTMLLKTQ